ncbi:hypothetical protein K474DRAFT_1774578 [Panus rudis PR-1116 ss-1]|nr:hypothetical protein K474DRAFT_1774578 [Panus rudis PR-1116 ss-1]
MLARQNLPLPDDVLLNIASYLGTADIRSLRATCRRWFGITTNKRLWAKLLQQNVILPGISMPTYCRRRNTLSATETEALVVHALDTRKNMLEGERKSRWRINNFDQTRSVTWVKFLQGQWLLFASSDLHSSKLTLCTLPNSSETSPPVVAQASLRAPVAEGFVEVQTGGVIIIALYLRGRPSSIEILSLKLHEGRPVFVHLKEYPHAAHIRFLRGNFIGFSLHQETSLPCVLNWRTDSNQHLHSEPSIEGCCIAMAMHGETLAVLMPRRLEIYLLLPPDDGQSFQLWRAIDIFINIGLAVLSYEHPPDLLYCDTSLRPCTAILRLLITCEQGLYLYDVDIDVDEDCLDLILCWHHVPKVPEAYCGSGIAFAINPRFSTSNTTFSWLVLDPEGSALDPRLSVATVPAGASYPSFEFAFDVEEMGCQYADGVRDFDEGRGLAVFGNPFGELSLYDFNNRTTPALLSCFMPVEFSPLCQEDIVLDDLPLRPTYAPPFPYAGSTRGKEHLTGITPTWRQYQLPTKILPAGWFNNEIKWAAVASSSKLIHTLFRWKAPQYQLEHLHHFLGEPILLMYKYFYQPGWTMFRAGGLLFLTNEGVELYLCVKRMSPVELARWVNEVRHPWPAHTLRRFSSEGAETTLYFRMMAFKRQFFVEREGLDWNRWQDLQDRGGLVHQNLLEW